MRNSLFSFILLLLLMISCQEGTENKTNKDVLDLKNSNFDENVLTIFGNWMAEENNVSLGSLMEHELSDEKLAYRIKDPIISAIHIQVPKADFGFLLESPFKDSIASYGPLFFKTVSVVTDLHKKPVAYQALAFYRSLATRDSILSILYKEWGKPDLETVVNKSIGLKAQEWILKDRTIQIVPFNAKELSLSSSSPDDDYYQVDFLMIDNAHKEALNKAHYYEFTEDIEIEGKLRNHTYFDLKKNQLFADRFLLYSEEEKDKGAGN